MNKPTLLSPWFVVVKYEEDVTEDSKYCLLPEWYIAQEGDNPTWSFDRKQAMLFNSIHSAHRVALAEGAYVIVVADEKDLKEYRDA
jgi:hypothetical protein